MKILLTTWSFLLFLFLIFLFFQTSLTAFNDQQRPEDWPVELKLKKLRKLHFSMSDNFYYFGGTKDDSKGLFTYIGYRYRVMPLNTNMTQLINPNIEVNFFKKDGKDLGCNFVFRIIEAHPMMGPPDIALTEEKDLFDNETITQFDRCYKDSNNNNILCYVPLLEEKKEIPSKFKYFLPPNPMLYGPHLRHRKPANFREIDIALTRMSVHDVMRTCAAGYLFRAMPMRDPNKLFMRDNWLLYLLDGKLRCHLSDRLKLGYTVSFIQLNTEFNDDEPNRACGFYSRLSAYADKNNPNGDFLLAGILGSASLDKYDYLKIAEMSNKEKGDLDQNWKKCAPKYLDLLRTAGNGEYRVRIQVSHRCTDDNNVETLNFEIKVRSEHWDDEEKGIWRAIIDYKDVEKNASAHAVVDLENKLLLMPDGEKINNLGHGHIPGWREPGGPINVENLENVDEHKRQKRQKKKAEL